MVSRLQGYIYYKEHCEPLQEFEIEMQVTLKQILIQIKSSNTFLTIQPRHLLFRSKHDLTIINE